MGYFKKLNEEILELSSRITELERGIQELKVLKQDLNFHKQETPPLEVLNYQGVIQQFEDRQKELMELQAIANEVYH